MVRLSRKKIEKYIWNKLFHIFYIILNKKKNDEDFSNFILSIFSYPEEVMIIKRIGIIYLLLRKYEKYKICKVLSVSKASVNKYRLIIEKNKEIYSYFIRLIEKENLLNIFEEVFNSLYGPGTYGIDWKAAWERKQKIEQRKIHRF